MPGFFGGPCIRTQTAALWQANVYLLRQALAAALQMSRLVWRVEGAEVDKGSEGDEG